MSQTAIGTGRVVMSREQVDRRVFAAVTAQAAAVRRWIGDVLDGHPCRDDALLVVTEFFANAVRHGSAGPGCVVAVCARRLPGGRVYVAVADSGGGGWPVRRDAGPEAVAGRGLAIVDGIAVRRGIRRSGAGWRVFALLAPPDAGAR